MMGPTDDRDRVESSRWHTVAGWVLIAVLSIVVVWQCVAYMRWVDKMADEQIRQGNGAGSTGANSGAGTVVLGPATWCDRSGCYNR